jgi:hypothetical protein
MTGTRCGNILYKLFTGRLFAGGRKKGKLWTRVAYHSGFLVKLLSVVSSSLAPGPDRNVEDNEGGEK